MAITTQTSQQIANITTSTVTRPAGAAAGDMLIALVSADAGAGASAWATATELYDGSHTGFVCTAAFRIVVGGDGDPVATHTTERSNHIAVLIPAAEWAADGTAPVVSTIATGSSVNPNPTGVTFPWSATHNTIFIAVVHADDSAPSGPITVRPTGYTNNQVENSTATSAGYIAIAVKPSSAASSPEDPSAFTMTGSETWASFVIAVKGTALGGGVTATPSPLTVPISFPTPTVTAGRVVTPSPLAVPIAFPTPAVAAGRVVTPDPLAIPIVFPVPTVSSGGGPVTVTPDPLVILLAFPTPAAAAGRVVTPDPLAVPLAFPVPSVSSGRTVAPSPLVIPLAFPVPVVVAGRVVTPDPLAIPILFPVPTVTAGGPVTVTPSPLVIALAFPAPTVTAVGLAAAMGRLHHIQYHGVIFEPNATGGPGNPKLELDPDILNLVWQQALNYPAQAAIGLTRFNSKLGDIDYMKDHIKLYREDDKGLKTVFSGKIIKPNDTATDAIIYAWDYVSFLQRSRTGFRVLYPEKTIKEIIDAEWALAKAADKSPFEFVATGTTETPLGLDGTTPIKTNSQFGVVMFDRLFTFFALAELAMANTDNTVVFEITREPPHTFNFWKNRSAQKNSYHLTFPGNLIDYDHQDGHDQITNDIATPILDPTTGAQVEYALTDTASKDEFRRLQAGVAIKTLFGINAGTTETDQQKAALARLLTISAGIPSLYTLFPRQGEITPFDGWDLGDSFRTTIQDPGRVGDWTDSYRKVTGIAGSWSPSAGELLQLVVR